MIWSNPTTALILMLVMVFNLFTSIREALDKSTPKTLNIIISIWVLLFTIVASVLLMI